MALRWKVALGDALTVLRSMHDRQAHCCVTSPPYFGLRDYGVEGQLGLEKTPEEYVAKLVAIFREVRRVLHDDGVLWLNLGDSYASGEVGRHDRSTGYEGDFQRVKQQGARQRGKIESGVKHKDLLGIPWMVAFALRTDGWYLRSDVIWEKPNPMPESVTDRPTKAHEYLFLLSKSEVYYYDRHAILEPFADKRMGRDGGKPSGIDPSANGGRNRRTVWRINAKPFKGAHFAVFPPELPALCIAAGSSEQCCGRCFKPFKRLIERVQPPPVAPLEIDRFGTGEAGVHRKDGQAYQDFLEANPPKTVGWKPSCDCSVAPVPSVVIDPFAGSGTTGEVALGLGREFFGIELNPEYVELAEGRIRASLAAPRSAPALGNAVQGHGSTTDENRLPRPDVPLFPGAVLPSPTVRVVGVQEGADGGAVSAGQGSTGGVYLGDHSTGGSGHALSVPTHNGVVK